MTHFEERTLRYSMLGGLQWHDVNTKLLEIMSVNQYKSDFLITAIYGQNAENTDFRKVGTSAAAAKPKCWPLHSDLQRSMVHYKWDNSVSIATRLRAGRPRSTGSIPCMGRRFFLSP
jgi:hypothetical protein